MHVVTVFCIVLFFFHLSHVLRGPEHVPDELLTFLPHVQTHIFEPKRIHIRLNRKLNIFFLDNLK